MLFSKLFHENFDFASKSIKISPWMIIILKVKWFFVRSIEENCELIYAEENCLLLISIAMQTVYHNQISLCNDAAHSGTSVSSHWVKSIGINFTSSRLIESTQVESIKNANFTYNWGIFNNVLMQNCQI